MKRISELTVDQMKKDHEAQQWKELTLGIDQLKEKYVYPFGKINPIKDREQFAQKTFQSSTNQIGGNTSVLSGINPTHGSLMQEDSLF